MEQTPQNPIETTPSSADLSAREAALAARELRLMASEELLKRGLSREVEGLLDYSDREKCLRSLDTAQKLIRQEAARIAEKSIFSRALPGSAATLDTDTLSDHEYYALTLGKR